MRSIRTVGPGRRPRDRRARLQQQCWRYPLCDQVAFTGAIAVDRTQFKAGPASTASVTVNADGSGKLTFASLVSTDGRSESGELAWICRF